MSKEPMIRLSCRSWRESGAQDLVLERIYGHVDDLSRDRVDECVMNFVDECGLVGERGSDRVDYCAGIHLGVMSRVSDLMGRSR